VALPIGEKRAGRVLTPEALAEALCRWAIRSSGDRVLDLGVGEGVFAVAAVERLRMLGADDAAAAAAIHGAEWDPVVFNRAQETARLRLGRELPNVVCADFYDTELPPVHAVVGNPPYIRRHYQRDLAKSRTVSGSYAASRLTDTYCYFLLRACSALRQGGRLAVVVSASWLDMKYGEDLKRLLVDQFRLHLLLAFDGRVFSKALVKPVVILAEKMPEHGRVTFTRLSHTVSLESLQPVLEGLAAGRLSPSAAGTRVDQSELSPVLPWTPLFKTPAVYADLGTHAPFTALKDVAESRIGLQTFAKRFYILTRNEAERWGIEPEYLLPLVFSPRDSKAPVIRESEQVRHVVFACNRPEAELRHTVAGRYISHGMRASVQVRGKDEIVQGFHRAPRVVRARRQPWYNLRTAIERRGSYPILLPRRVFESYLVVHNLAGVIANEDFIELRPLNGEDGVAPLLAFMNSSIGEFLVRSHGFQYGGGVFNLNPGPVREIPVLDFAEISADDRATLTHAWETFVADYGRRGARHTLSHEVANVLGLSPGLLDRVEEALAQLVQLARAAHRTH
jgi:adenine-specific DNA-methyltransferase